MSTICHCYKEYTLHTLVWKKHLEILLRCWVIWKAWYPPSLSGVSFWRPDLASWRLNFAFFLHVWESPELVASPQLTSLHSTGNTSAEGSVNKNEVGHNSTRGIVSPLLFFPLNYCCTKSTFPTSYVDWGYCNNAKNYKNTIVNNLFYHTCIHHQRCTLNVVVVRWKIYFWKTIVW